MFVARPIIEVTVTKAAESAPIPIVEAALPPKAAGKKPAQSCGAATPKKSSKSRSQPFSKHKRRLRASIKPGVVLILLSSVHRGKRVVFLKQLASGLLLVTGPLRMNGCPLRRVHQQMVIATSTQIDMSDIAIPASLTDEYFCRNTSDASATNSDNKPSTDVSSIFAKTQKQYVLHDRRKADQKIVDSQIVAAVKKREDKAALARYLRQPFSLSGHDYPHKMQF